VPFTLSHAAAALPFRRWRLVPSALVIGTFAPDFEYLLRLSPSGRYGHTLAGSFALTLPLALLVLWIFHALVKRPAAMLLPEAVRRRLQTDLGEFRFGGAARFLLIIASILLGIATHLLWDSFTHTTTWPYRHWQILRQLFTLPVLGPIPLYKILQHGSTIAGIGIIFIWLARWYSITKPSAPAEKSLSPHRKAAVVAVMASVALVGAIVRALVGIGMPTGHFAFNHFVAQAVVTALALVWWQLLAYGLVAATSETRDRPL
jgi:Domain of unknown function (DUF4184)